MANMTDPDKRIVRDVQESDDGAYVLGLRETLEPDSWSMLFMASEDEPDEQDAGLGMDSYCIVVDPGQATTYGGVRTCEIVESDEPSTRHESAASLSITFSELAAADLRLPASVQFILLLDDAHMALLRQGLHRVLTSGRADDIPSILVTQ